MQAMQKQAQSMQIDYVEPIPKQSETAQLPGVE
jgi:hypothetical protein